MEFSLENMCRACMNEEGSMYSVYGKEKNLELNVNYAEMLKNFASVQIEDEDGLPTQICQYCLKQLLIAYTFKQTIERSDATLREITKNPGIEFIKEEIMDNYSDDEEQKHLVLNFQLDDSIKTEENDFKLTAEFLDDDFHVIEEENDFTSDPIGLEENPETSNDDNKHQQSNEIEYMFKSVNKSHFIPSIEQLKQSVLKPKSSRKVFPPLYPTSELKEFIPQLPKIASISKIKKTTKQYICPLCSKQFVKFETFKKHKKLHKTLKCELCEKEFRSTHGLRYHMKIHSGVRNYVCTFENCTKKFRLKQALDKHLSIHNNEKNHLCPICGKTYAQYDALHYHIRNHTGERPYLCVHCGKTFKQSCHLKNHMWNHTGIKPHNCKSCGKCYTTGHQLKKHLRKYCNNPNYVNDKFKIEEHTLEIENNDEHEETENATNTIYIKSE